MQVIMSLQASTSCSYSTTANAHLHTPYIVNSQSNRLLILMEGTSQRNVTQHNDKHPKQHTTRCRMQNKKGNTSKPTILYYRNSQHLLMQLCCVYIRHNTPTPHSRIKSEQVRTYIRVDRKRRHLLLPVGINNLNMKYLIKVTSMIILY